MKPTAWREFGGQIADALQRKECISVSDRQLLELENIKSQMHHIHSIDGVLPLFVSGGRRKTENSLARKHGYASRPFDLLKKHHIADVLGVH